MEEFTLARKGYVPYKITEEQYKIFVEMISDERRKRLEDAIREAYDFFPEDEFIKIISEELQDLGIYLHAIIKIQTRQEGKER